ncbi:MAG TPA: hypothetical protein VF727_07875 [Allosphingosinicella sp.]|jgi:hypothetical protein
MPRYFFHFDAPSTSRRDEIGVTLPDVEAAWYQAVRWARDEMGSEGTGLELWEAASVHIVDESGLPVDRVPLGEIARFAGGVA